MISLPSNIFSRMDQLFQDTFSSSHRRLFDLDFGSVNLKDKDGSYEMLMALPGLSDQDVKIEVKAGVLNIKAEGTIETKEEEKEYLIREFSYGQIDRSFTLPRNIDVDKIEAKMDKGVLHISLPKAGDLAESKKIEVK